MSLNPLSPEIHHKGWLVKSPPLERAAHNLIKARWRRRFFVLQEKSGQFLLNYFSDEKSYIQGKKPKGSISLDECEQVDIGLTVDDGKQRYDYMFDIKTPGRIYYLAAESQEEMNTWVRLVCSACGLKAYQDEDEPEPVSDFNGGFLGGTNLDPNPKSQAESLNNNQNNISGPYIHISTCYTGGQPPGLSKQSDNNSESSKLELSNYELGEDSVFLPHNFPMDNANHENLAQILKDQSLKQAPSPPDRPPKPAHLANRVVRNAPMPTIQRDNYANSNEMEEMYQKEIAQASVSSQTPISSLSVPYPPSVTPLVFDGCGPVNVDAIDNAMKPGPVISRELKPGRDRFGPKSATMGPTVFQPTSNGNRRAQHPVDNHNLHHFATLSSSYCKNAPPVPRALKPKNAALSDMDLSRCFRNRNAHSVDLSSGDEDATTFSSGFETNGQRPSNQPEEQIYYYMPSLDSVGDGKYPTMIPADNYEHPSLSYIDLDLLPPTSESPSSTTHDLLQFSDKHPKFSSRTLPAIRKTSRNAENATAYKKIDFVKTEAFNRTRYKVEEEKYNQEQA